MRAAPGLPSRVALGGIVALALAVALAGAFRMPLNGDAAYVLDVARRMLRGSVLYRDIIDLNPPFIFWASLPAAAVGRTGPEAIVAFKLCVLALILGSLAAGWRVTRGAPATRAGFIAMALLLPGGYFGQREHLLFGLTFPYLALAARRHQGEPVSGSAATLAGVLAAAGIALKPTALLAAGLVLLEQCRSARSWRPLLAREQVALAAGLGIAAGSVLLFAPDYAGVVERIQGPYREFNRESLRVLLARDAHMWVVWLALAATLAFGGTVAAPRRIRIQALAAIGLFASAVFQGKGFGYHYFPAVGWALIILFELCFGASAPARAAPMAPARRAVAALLLLPVLYLFGAVTWRRAHGVFTRARSDQAVVARLAGAAPVDIAVLSARIADAYPLVLERGHHVVLSYPQFWAAALAPDHPGTAAIRRRYGEDLTRRPPAVLIVRAPAPVERAAGDLAVDYLEYLCGDAVARAALTRYRLAERAGGFELYRLDAAGHLACASS